MLIMVHGDVTANVAKKYCEKANTGAENRRTADQVLDLIQVGRHQINICSRVFDSNI